MKTPACSEEVTAGWLEVILSQHESWAQPKTTVQVTNFKISQGVSPGENFNSSLKRIKVMAILEGPETHQETHKEYNLLAKFQQGTAFTREVSKFMKNAHREVALYSQVMPVLKEFTEDARFRVQVPEFVHGVCREGEFVLVMEDARLAGYHNTDRRHGLNLQQCLMAVESLAKVHASSYVYDKKYDFINKFPAFKEYKGASKQLGFFAMIMYDSIWKVLEKTKTNDKLTDKLKQNRAKAKSYLKTILDPNNHRVRCLCHGDFWSNNFMFKAREGDGAGLANPSSVMMVDWGNVQWGNPVLDLQYLLHTSTTPAFRRSHWEEVMQHYHSTFTANIEALDEAEPMNGSDALYNEMRDASLYGLLSGIMLNVMSLRDYNSGGSGKYEASATIDSSSVGWKIRSRLGRVMAPVFTHGYMRPLLRTSVETSIMSFFDGIFAKENHPFQKRFLELLTEADKNGVFDI